VLGAHEALLDAYRTDVRPLLAAARAARGAADDPVAALRGSGYVERARAQRGGTETVAGGWAR
jgi:L-rhamnose isomerase/sugar isomerase